MFGENNNNNNNNNNINNNNNNDATTTTTINTQTNQQQSQPTQKYFRVHKKIPRRRVRVCLRSQKQLIHGNLKERFRAFGEIYNYKENKKEKTVCIDYCNDYSAKQSLSLNNTEIEGKTITVLGNEDKEFYEEEEQDDDDEEQEEDEEMADPSSEDESSKRVKVILLDHKGLFNPGNTCYMNVILQSLFSIKKLFRDINRAKSKIFKEDIEIYNVLLDTLKAIKATNNYDILSSKSSFKIENGNVSVNPKLLKLSIDKLTPMFIGNHQHDAQEFLVSFLGVLEESLKSFFIKRRLAAIDSIQNDGSGKDSNEVENPMEIENSSVGKKSIQDKEFKESIDTEVEESCPIRSNFKSSITNIFQCCNCNDIQYSVEVFNDISLNVPKTTNYSIPLSSNYRANKNVRLDTLFEQYFREEVVDRNCTKCKHGKSKLLKAFKKTPDILVLHLKRFQNDSSSGIISKNDSAVQPLDSITLNQYDIIIPESNNDNKENVKETTSPVIPTTTAATPVNNSLNEIIRKSERETVEYSLQSIIVHCKESEDYSEITADSGGHYTCCMNVNNSWKLFDDSHVFSIDKSAVLSNTNGYIFFYIRNNSKASNIDL